MGGDQVTADAERLPIHRQPPAFAEQSGTTEILETGIKVLDLITPFPRGGKVGAYGGAGVGKTVIITELIRTSRKSTPAYRIRRCRVSDRVKATTLARNARIWRRRSTALVFGQMNEPPERVPVSR